MSAPGFMFPRGRVKKITTENIRLSRQLQLNVAILWTLDGPPGITTGHHADTLHCTLSILSLLQHFQYESLDSSWLLRLLLSASTQCLTSTRASLHVLISILLLTDQNKALRDQTSAENP